MRGFRGRNLAVALTGIICLGIAGHAQAGMFPRAYSSYYGPGPAYGYGVAYRPFWTQSSYYSPAWSSYSVSYAPAFSYSAYGAGIANYGYANPCCAPCDPCSSCGTGNCWSGNCAGGNCESGNCGAGYAPDIKNGPTPEPTRTNDPPAANPPVNRSNPPVDDFTPVPPRTNDNPMPGGSAPSNNSNPNSTIPNSVNPGSTIPGSSLPGSTVPGSGLPGGSTIPDNTLPGGSTIPRSNAIPDLNDLPNAAPFDGGAGSGSGSGSGTNNDGFERPMNRDAVPYELNKPDMGTGPTGLQPVPLKIEPASVASVQIHRERIVSQAGYRLTPVARMAISPRLIPAELAQK